MKLNIAILLLDSMEEQRHELFHEFERERRRWEDEKNSYVKQIDNHKKEKEVLNVPPVVKGDDEMDDRMKQVCFIICKLIFLSTCILEVFLFFFLSDRSFRL